MRWVGIDEAGYGPNLGPMVMTAVVAEGADFDVDDDDDIESPNLWRDLAATVCRAGGPGNKLWVDDSKRIYKGRQGLDRLDVAAMATLALAGKPLPRTLDGLLDALGSGSTDAELTPWLDGSNRVYPSTAGRALVDRTMARRPLEGASWRIVDVRSVVVGPMRFNAGLDAMGSKALVHFDAFARLLAHLKATTPKPQSVSIRSDKHGGRHFYGDLLARVFPEGRIVAGPEGPDLSRYEVLDGALRMTLSLVPRADADDGLVALASIISKGVREHWMDVFNAYWMARVPDLKPSAGYPVDAARFREGIEEKAASLGVDSRSYWREK